MSALEPPVPPTVDDDSIRLGANYLLTDRIGTSFSGEVWRGTEVDSGEPVAAKILALSLTTDGDVVARFIRERKMLKRIEHPNVVRVRDLVVEGETLAIVSDLVEGPNLRAVLDRRETLRPALAIELTVHVLEGLQAVHEGGLVHRDLKPENVLVDASDEDATIARVVDFGIAELAHKEAADGPPVGSVEYTAPELLANQPATPASDLYSVGILLYELLCGRTPFAAEVPANVMLRHQRERPRRPPGMPDELWSVLRVLLAKDPSSRPASAAAVADRLRPLVARYASVPRLAVLPAVVEPAPDETIQSPVVPAVPPALRPPVPPPVEPAVADVRPPRRPRPERRRRRTARVAALVAVVLVLTAVGVVLLPGGGTAQASVVSPPEHYGDDTLVERTLTMSGDDLTATMEVAMDEGRHAITEFVPKRLLADGAVPEFAGNALVGTPTGKDGGWKLDLTSPTRATRTVTYTVRLADGGAAALSAFERRRSELLKDADLAIDTIDRMVSTPIEMHLRAGERAWLHLAGHNPATGDIETAWTRRSVFAKLHWDSSDDAVARETTVPVQPDEAAEGVRRDAASYPIVDAIGPGRATLRTWVHGSPVTVRVVVSGSGGGEPCEPGVLRSGALVRAGSSAQPAEGTVAQVGKDAVSVWADGGYRPVGVGTSALCAHAAVFQDDALHRGIHP